MALSQLQGEVILAKPPFRWRLQLDERNKLEIFLESLFLEQGPDGFVDNLSSLFGPLILTKDGIIIGVNDSFLEMAGYEREILCGMQAVELVPDRHKYRLSELFARSSTDPYVMDILPRDGSTLRVRVSPKYFYAEDEYYRLAEFVDITETHYAEKGLSESEEKFKAIFSHGAVGIARISLDGKWLDVNNKFCDILGYTHVELESLSFEDITHPADLAKDTALIMETLDNQRDSYTLEKRYVRKDGETIWGRLSISLIRDTHGVPSYIIAFIEDISERVNLNNRLQLSDQIVTSSTDLLAIIDAHGVYLATNEAYAKAFGRELDYFTGKFVKDVFGETIEKNIMQPMVAKARQGLPANYSDWFNIVDKGRRYLNVSYSPLQSSDSEYHGVAISARDITDLKIAEIEMRALNEKLESYSFVDGLTKITNRRMLDDCVAKEWNRALRAKTPLAFIMIDLDYFKKYNDHFGHPQGDECLKKIANILTRVANRSTDVVARYGGEEFAILTPFSDINQATQLAEICRTAIEEEKIPHASTGDASLNIVTVSIGVNSLIPHESNSIAQLIEGADRLLYKAKNAGRNRVFSA